MPPIACATHALSAGQVGAFRAQAEGEAQQEIAELRRQLGAKAAAPRGADVQLGGENGSPTEAAAEKAEVTAEETAGDAVGEGTAARSSEVGGAAVAAGGVGGAAPATFELGGRSYRSYLDGVTARAAAVGQADSEADGADEATREMAAKLEAVEAQLRATEERQQTMRQRHATEVQECDAQAAQLRKALEAQVGHVLHLPCPQSRTPPPSALHSVRAGEPHGTLRCTVTPLLRYTVTPPLLRYRRAAWSSWSESWFVRGRLAYRRRRGTLPRRRRAHGTADAQQT